MPDPVYCANDNREVWVVFTGQSDLKIVSRLKTGFRHCFVLIKDQQRWISIDPLANYTEVMVHDLPEGFDFALWLEELGHRAVKTELARDTKKCAPVMLFTCVEACKRVLGIHKPLIITPWQLYKFLTSKYTNIL